MNRKSRPWCIVLLLSKNSIILFALSVIVVQFITSLSAQSTSDGRSPITFKELIDYALSAAPAADLDKHARQLLPYFQLRHSTESTRRGYLCSTFIKWGSGSAMHVLMPNLLHTHRANFCDWIIVVYHANNFTEDGMYKDLRSRLHSKLANSNVSSAAADGSKAQQDDILVKEIMKNRVLKIIIAPVKQKALPILEDLCYEYFNQSHRPLARHSSSSSFSSHHHSQQQHSGNRDDHNISNRNASLLMQSVIKQLTLSPCSFFRYHNYTGTAHADLTNNNNYHNNTATSTSSSSPWEETDSIPINPNLYSRFALEILLLPYTAAYRYIWLLDGDISLSHMDLAWFKQVHQCGLSALPHPPLIAQPLIYEATQFYKFLHRNQWLSDPSLLATSTGFVEVQAPLVDGLFFEWFITAFVFPVILPLHILGGDWGYDCLYCESARQFVLGIHYEQWTEEQARHVCMLPISNLSVHHLDSNDMISSVGKEWKWKLNGALYTMMGNKYPSFFQPGDRGHLNPLIVSNKFMRSKEVRSGCSIV